MKKQKKSKFNDDGRTIADMNNVGSMSDMLFGIRANKDSKRKQATKTEKNIPEESVYVSFKLTDKEKRAMTRAAWLLGLKVALIGSGALLTLFLIMHLLVYFWK